MSIELNNLTVTFKNGLIAVNHVNLSIGHGIYGLLGENGAGKTTLMRVLTTMLAPTEGTVTLDGIPYIEQNYGKIQRKIGYLPQELNLYPNLSVRDCLLYMGELAGISKPELIPRLEDYLNKTGLSEHQKKKIRQLSGGMKRRVGLIQALLHEPDFLIVDEPTTGLDPEERIRIRNLLVDFSENRTVLFSTHVIEDLSATCNQLAVMKRGTFLFSGDIREMMKEAHGCVWKCFIHDDTLVRKIEKEHHVSTKQCVNNGWQLKIISPTKPAFECFSKEATLEDAYIYITNWA